MLVRASFLLVLAIALAGCSKSRTRTADGGRARVDSGPPITMRDAGDDDLPPPTPPRDAGPPRPSSGYEFVISRLAAAEVDPAGRPDVVPGFDLDGRVSGDSDPEGCFHPDYTSPPPDDEPGVDNQLGPIVASLGSLFDIEGGYRMHIGEGSYFFLLRVSDVDDRFEDPTVVVELFEGRTAAGGAPALDASGGLEPGQAFVVGGLVASSPGEIRAGRVRARMPDTELWLPIRGGITPWRFSRGQMRFDIGEAGLEHAVMGGVLDVEESVAVIVGSAPDEIPESLARSVLEGQADLSPDARGDCQEISMALVFEAIPAVIE